MLPPHTATSTLAGISHPSLQQQQHQLSMNQHGGGFHSATPTSLTHHQPPVDSLTHPNPTHFTHILMQQQQPITNTYSSPLSVSIPTHSSATPTNTLTPTHHQASAAFPLSHSNVYIAGIPHIWSKIHLDDYFSHWGVITESRILIDKVTQLNRGIAFVRYKDIESAKMCIMACHGSIAPGGMEKLVVRPATDRHTLQQMAGPLNLAFASLNINVPPIPPTNNVQTNHHPSMLNASLVALNQSTPTSPTTSHLYPATQTIPAASSSIHSLNPRPITQLTYQSPTPLHLRGGAYPEVPLTQDGSSYSHTSSAPNYYNQMSSTAATPLPVATPSHSHTRSRGHHETGVQLFVFHLPPQLTNEELIPLFSHFGHVLGCAIMRDPLTGQSKGFAFITMVNTRDADQAIRYLNGFNIGNKYLKVEYKTKKHQQKYGGGQGEEQQTSHDGPNRRKEFDDVKGWTSSQPQPSHTSQYGQQQQQQQQSTSSYPSSSQPTPVTTSSAYLPGLSVNASLVQQTSSAYYQHHASQSASSSSYQQPQSSPSSTSTHSLSGGYPGYSSGFSSPHSTTAPTPTHAASSTASLTPHSNSTSSLASPVSGTRSIDNTTSASITAPIGFPSANSNLS